MQNPIDDSQGPSDLNRNGSFFERRKMYPMFALHNLKSSIHIDWTPRQYHPSANRIQQKQQIQHEYIKRQYNHKIERQLTRRYNQNNSTFRVLMQDPNSKDILEHELENFISSKELSASMLKPNPEYPKESPPKLSASEVEMLKQQHLRKERQRVHQQNELIRHNPGYASQDRYQIQQKYNYENRYSPYMYRKQYSQDLPKNYKKYPDLYHGDGVESYQYPFKNVLPDRLQEFLRQNTKYDNKKHLHQTKMKNPSPKRQKSI